LQNLGLEEKKMEFKKLAIDSLVPASYNPRKKLQPGDSEFEKIKNSINQFFFVDSIIVNHDLTVIGGHQRLSVLKTLGYTEIDCVVIEIDKTIELDEKYADVIVMRFLQQTGSAEGIFLLRDGIKISYADIEKEQ